ncbi:hypothetical protein BASA81_010538 [Batrachochytrium salamandrivorans]|nr:hypothetical protein BASA81_010538 [Batrachochytrium salamandrivorans]
MLSCFRGVRAARTGCPSFGDKSMPRDEALERFDQLRIREVGSMDGLTASAFLAEFRSIAASLEPDERIKLVVFMHESGVELMKDVLADPLANKICSLHWEYGGWEDVNPVIPLLVNSCPELASLRADFWHYSAIDFASTMLEHPSNKLKELEMTGYAQGDFARFFGALGQSQVSAINIRGDSPPKFAQGLCKYLARDLLARLNLRMGFRKMPSAMMVLLAKCTRLTELKLNACDFSPPTTIIHLSKSITKLELNYCTFVDGVDWSFLADSNVRELDFDHAGEVNGTQLGNALAVHLRTKGLDKLRLFDCDFVNETLAVVGVEIGRIKRLDLGFSNLDDASVELLALALQSPDGELRELMLWHNWSAASIKDHLLPALKHPNCNLVKLSLSNFEGQTEAAGDAFRNRLALFVLLQGQQMKKRYCPLRRLPGDLFRLVGMVLI